MLHCIQYSVNKVFVIHLRHELHAFHEVSKGNLRNSSNACKVLYKNVLYSVFMLQNLLFIRYHSRLRRKLIDEFIYV